MNTVIIKYFIVIIMVLSNFTRAIADTPDRPFATSPQFSYGFKNELAFGHKPGIELDSTIELLAMKLNKHLNQSILFDTSFVAHSQEVRKFIEKKKPAKEFVGKRYSVTTDDGVALNATYFDRGSDTLIVIAEGFANVREYMAPFIAMFHDYDLVIFDFRGHGIHDGYSLFNPLKSAFGVDRGLVTLGHKEDKDVHAIVDGFKKLKSYDKTTQQYDPKKGYKHVFGLGLCFGAFILTKAQATSPGLFDKLILDGCWHSLDLFTNKIKNDLYTIWSPQTGGWSDHWFFGNAVVKDAIEIIVKNFLIEIKDISLLDYAKLITQTPVLCIHGKDDYMIYKNEFEQLWNSFATPNKTALITSNPHVRNHWKQKELYKLICELFFDVGQEEFVHYLQNTKDLALYHTNKHAQNIING